MTQYGRYCATRMDDNSENIGIDQLRAYYGGNVVDRASRSQTSREAAAIGTRPLRRRIGEFDSGGGSIESNYKFRTLNAGVSPGERPKKRSWLNRLIWGSEESLSMHYDETLHELHASTSDLEKSVKELEVAVQPFMAAPNPLVALTIALLNEQQWRTPDDSESNS
jgi:hypothetical protein